MKFVDESTIDVLAGKGGDGCLSFRREKFIPRGGPNGGDGGDGGSIFLVVDRHVNTLIHYRHARIHRAENGQPGMGNNKRGKSGEDLYLSVPAGTRVFDEETGELIGDLSRQGQQLCVARGGFHGLGNARYKSSTNRSPRQTTKGSPGDVRRLRLALSVLADVGVLGLPNAGKSTLIHAISNAKPKVADYPFTTLYPMLGVVLVDSVSSFVISDIPGLIEGASSGTGLGVQFLKHLSRCRVLLHVIDVTCPDALTSARGILRELEIYSDRLYTKPRWLVLNKIDCLDQAQLAEVKQTITEGLQWEGPVFEISALQRSGTKALCHAVAQYLETLVTDTDAPMGEDDHLAD